MEMLFVADPLETFNVRKDSTFAMMREVSRRGHAILACEPADLAWQRGGRVEARLRAIELTGEKDRWFAEAGPASARSRCRSRAPGRLPSRVPWPCAQVSSSPTWRGRRQTPRQT